MSTPENQIIRLKEKDGSSRPAFLLLTGQVGSDFTFHVRNERDESAVRQILQKESGQAAPASPEQGASFSCRISVLHPLLHKDDLKREEGGRREVVFLRKLRAAKRAKGAKAASNPYAALRRELKEATRDKLDGGRLTDEELPRFVEELNRLMARGLPGGRFKPALPETEEDLLRQVDDGAKAALGNYLRFCSLFGDAIEPISSRLRVGRVQACLSYEGACWSVCFRKQESGTGYAPPKGAGGYLSSFEEICCSLYEEIFYAVSRSGREGEARHATPECRDEKARPAAKSRRTLDEHRATPLSEVGGLVVIAGSTNSGKSQVTRGLIHLYLENVLRAAPKRRPHLVTFEDPIERYFVATARTSGDGRARRRGGDGSWEGRVDYTPRQRWLDAPDLESALHDALRQTPKVFFVGETRRDEDWRTLIDFAGTGHLVVTTAHAGSLIEAMHKILLATEAKTPADRNEVASRILAVVQLKRTEVAGYEGRGVLVPSLWRRVPRGVDSLTADGLASILPHSHSGDEKPCSCLGRKYFAEQLLKLAEDAGRRPELDFAAALREKAVDWDLKGE